MTFGVGFGVGDCVVANVGESVIRVVGNELGWLDVVGNSVGLLEVDGLAVVVGEAVICLGNADGNSDGCTVVASAKSERENTARTTRHRSRGEKGCERGIGASGGQGGAKATRVWRASVEIFCRRLLCFLCVSSPPAV